MSNETRGYHHSGSASQCHPPVVGGDPCTTRWCQFRPASGSPCHGAGVARAAHRTKVLFAVPECRGAVGERGRHAISWRWAQAAAAERDETSIFVKMLVTCALTVRMLMYSASAIS